MTTHYQCRFVKRLDDQRVVTFAELGKMYPHGQKSLKGYHTLEKAIELAEEYNRNLPSYVIGLVILRHKASGNLCRYITPSGRTGYRKEVKKEGTTEWVRFINRNNEHFELDPKTHMILRRI